MVEGFFLFWGIVLGFALIFAITRGCVRRWRKKMVLAGSLKLAALNVLNKTSFYDIAPISINVRCFNRKSLNNIDLFHELVQNIVENDRVDTIKVMLTRIDENREKYKKYTEDCQWIICDDVFTRGDLKDARIAVNKRDVDMKIWEKYHAKKWFLKTENALFQEKRLNPDLDFVVTVKAIYDSPKGEVHLERTEKFNSDECMLAMEIIRDVEEYKKTREYQRSLMSASLRYDVMKRDGFKCVICGASADDGAKLHVDHIKPIAKGGKTELDNLRTLCSDCNLGKSDKYEEESLN